MRILGKLFALVGFIASAGIASVAAGIMYLWWKDRQWEKELNRTGSYKDMLATPRAGETSRSTIPQEFAKPAVSMETPEYADTQETSDLESSTVVAASTSAREPAKKEAVAESPAAEAPKSPRASTGKTKAASKSKSGQAKRPKSSASSRGKSKA